MDLGEGRDLMDLSEIHRSKKKDNKRNYNEVNYSWGSYWLDSPREEWTNFSTNGRERLMADFERKNVNLRKVGDSTIRIVVPL